MQDKVYSVKVTKSCSTCLKFKNCKRDGKLKKEDAQNWGCWAWDKRSKI